MTKWQIFSAIALRRLPELSPSMDLVETKVQAIFSAYEIAKSKLSSHELQHIEDIKIKDGGDLDALVKETALDREDKWLKEKSNFKFGAYDERLTHTQYLFMRQKFGSDIRDQWLLPQAMYDAQKDENLLDTARRILREKLDISNGFKIVSKIPSSVYSFNYPKKIVELTGYKGAKVFFLKAHLDLPDATVLKAVDSFQNDNLRWATRNEALQFVHKKYMLGFSRGLLHEDRVDTNRVLAKASSYAKTFKAINVR